MDFSAPYRADVQACCVVLWQCVETHDAQALAVGLHHTCVALRRWLLLPFHLPEERAHLAGCLAQLEQCHELLKARTAASARFPKALHQQVRTVLLALTANQ